MVVGWWFVFGFAGSDGVGGLCLGLPAVFGFAGCGLFAAVVGFLFGFAGGDGVCVWVCRQ
uniref:Transmembrane protein n=1 Tax=Fagus sylvatica TaxID=28930 RepID=A0A2N9G5E3_FAGSY